MKRAPWPMTVAFLSAAVLLLAYLFLIFLGGQRIGFLYGRVADFNTARTVADWAGAGTGIAFVVASAIVTIPLALQPGNWLRKILAVLPFYLLLVALAGVAAFLAGIGTLGNLAVLPVLGPVTFASGWLSLGAVLAALAILVAVAVAPFSPATIRAASTALGVTALAGAITTLAVIAALVVVSTTQPAAAPFGPRGGNQNFEGRSGTPPAPGGQGAPGGQIGGGGEFRPGGEGGAGGAASLSAARQQFAGAGALLVLSGLVLAFSALAGFRRLRAGSNVVAPETAGPAVAANTGRELVRAVVAAAIVTIVVGVVL